jgi:biopolymer transport protein ExbB/TolQ
MIATVWKILTSRLAGPIASGVALALALALVFVWTADHATMLVLKGAKASAERTLETRTKERDSARSDLSTCKANADQLASGIRAQNEAIALMQKEADRRAAEANKAVAAARGVADSYRQKADAILARKPGEDRCASADRLILESLDVR